MLASYAINNSTHLNTRLWLMTLKLAWFLKHLTKILNIENNAKAILYLSTSIVYRYIYIHIYLIYICIYISITVGLTQWILFYGEARSYILTTNLPPWKFKTAALIKCYNLVLTLLCNQIVKKTGDLEVCLTNWDEWWNCGWHIYYLWFETA